MTNAERETTAQVENWSGKTRLEPKVQHVGTTGPAKDQGGHVSWAVVTRRKPPKKKPMT